MAFHRKDVILAFGVGIGAWVVSVLWIPSLRLTPYAFILGILAGWTTAAYCLFLGTRRSEDIQADAFTPVTSLALSSTSWVPETLALKKRRTIGKPQSESIPRTVDKSLDSLLDFIVRDFVKSWYGKISSGSTFPQEVDRTIRLALDNVAEKLQTIDVVHLAVSSLLPVIDSHLEKFAEAEQAVRGKEPGKDAGGATEEVDIAIATKFDNGKLHPAAKSTGARSDALQKQHLRSITEKMLPLLLPESVLGSSSVFTIMREIFAGAVFFPAMQMLTDPDFLNQHIEAYGRSVLQERKTVKRLRAALDEATSNSQGMGDSEFPFLSSNDSEKMFEQFIRAIRQCNGLQDARRIQGEIARQIEQEKIVGTQDITFLRRLEIGKRLLDQRIEQLSDLAVQNATARVVYGPGGASKPSVSLRDILYDTNGLSYLMEYMDSSDKMIYVQFWIVVDGLRNPSERIFDDNIEYQPNWGEAERQIINKINNNYCWRPELKVSSSGQSAVNEFLEAGEHATLRQYNAARRVILDAQAQVFHEIEDSYFLAFKGSDLYAKSGFPMDEPASTPTTTKTEPVRIRAEPRPGALRVDARSQTSLPPTTSLRSPDLRRAIASSSDLFSEGKRSQSTSPIRRSLDDNSSRTSIRRPLFGEGDDDTDPLTKSTGSLDSDPESPLELSNDRQSHGVHDVQAALANALEDNDDRDSLFERRSVNSSQDPGSERDSIDIKRPGNPQDRPTLSSLGLLGTPSKRTVFNSDDLFGENEKLWEDESKEANDTSADEQTDEDAIKKAAPGDLGLAEVVQSMSVEINKLEAQQTIVKSLLSKAELTNNVAELRILRKSQASLSREIRRKELQRQQYIVQETDNSLYRKASVSIKNIMVGTEPDGHEFALYVIEVARKGASNESNDEESSASWAITRRYSEFHELHRRLRRRFPTVKETEFPRRQMVLTLQKEFLKKRRAALERYLRMLLQDPEICRSVELRAFLSQQSIRALQSSSEGERVDRKDLVSRIYNSVSDGMEEFLGNIPVVEQLSTAGQNLITAATTAALSPVSPTPGQSETSDVRAFVPASIANDPSSAAEAQRELSALEVAESQSATAAAARKATTFIAPIASAFLTLFQLRTSTASAWLRGRAVIIVLQQLLGGTVERRVRDTFASLTAPAQLAKYIDQIRDAVWPGGGPMVAKPLRNKKDKDKSRTEAGVVLAAVLIDVAGGVIGRGVASEAGKRVGRMIGNERILRGLAYRILDEFVDTVWGVRA